MYLTRVSRPKLYWAIDRRRSDDGRLDLGLQERSIDEGVGEKGGGEALCLGSLFGQLVDGEAVSHDDELYYWLESKCAVEHSSLTRVLSVVNDGMCEGRPNSWMESTA